jgi:hypothetical protein
MRCCHYYLTVSKCWPRNLRRPGGGGLLSAARPERDGRMADWGGIGSLLYNEYDNINLLHLLTPKGLPLFYDWDER